MHSRYENDRRAVMTLDAGGTSLRFGAYRGNRPLTAWIGIPTEAANLDRCLGNIVRGFRETRDALGEPPVAISFAFPGPADYPAGIIGDLPNFPAFRGGVPLGPLLEDEFGVPVFVGNDGDFFTYGEALAGFLPYVNGLLERAGSPKRYRNLFGITIGTGLGGGMVCNGDLVVGDNSCAGEAWILRNRLNPGLHAEEGASIRAVRRYYAELSRTGCDDSMKPKAIFEIAMGQREGNQAAAREAFRRVGTVAGDVLAQALTLVDGLAVIGGGISDAHPFFMPALVDAMNDSYRVDGNAYRRLVPRAFNAEDPEQLADLIHGDVRELKVPGSGRTVKYDQLQRTLVGISKLGTSNAVAIGACCFALSRLDRSSS